MYGTDVIGGQELVIGIAIQQTTPFNWKPGHMHTWDYVNHHINCHMPGYISKVLTKFQHPVPASPQHAPYKAAPIQCSVWVQVREEDKSLPLTPSEIKHLQDIVGTLLCNVCIIDSTLLTALSTITVRQTNGTQAVANKYHQLLDKWQLTLTPVSITMPAHDPSSPHQCCVPVRTMWK
jgi:hypothetical protein